jgi:hypothetical protein
VPSKTLVAVTAGTAGWALLPGGAVIPFGVVCGVALLLKQALPQQPDEQPPPLARQVRPVSLWAGWDSSPVEAAVSEDLVVAGERRLWRVGEGYVLEQDGSFRPISALAARGLVALAREAER